MENAKITFEGKVAVITGGGGGLGRKYAVELAGRGAAVVVNDLGTTYDGTGQSASMAQGVVAEIEAMGGIAIASTDSVTTREGGEAIVGAALDRYGRVDIVIHNAGTLRNARFGEIPDDTIDSMIDVHLKGAFHVCQPAFRAMKKQNFGRMVLTSSSAGIFGSPDQAAYAAAKSGLLGLMNAVALEVAGQNIHCNLLLPTAATRMAAAMKPEQMAVMGQIWASVAGKLGNSGDGDFVVPMVAYLASEACTTSQGLYSAAFGRYACAQVVMGDGWLGPRDVPATAEDAAAHFDRIADLKTAIPINSITEEFQQIARQLERI